MICMICSNGSCNLVWQARDVPSGCCPLGFPCLRMNPLCTPSLVKYDKRSGTPKPNGGKIGLGGDFPGPGGSCVSHRNLQLGVK